MKKLILPVALFLFAVPAGGAEPPDFKVNPGDVAAAEFLPSRFITGQVPPGLVIERATSPSAPASVEKPSGVTGELYTVVAPLFLGGQPDGGNTSFIRLFNDSGHNTTFKVNIVAYKTDSATDSSSNIVGTANVTVPNFASVQYAATELLNLVGWGSIACPVACLEHAYQGASFYITTPDVYTAYQHVIYNGNSRFFENMTLCGDKSYSDAKVAGNVIELINVHSTKLPGYPAYITLHNYAAGARTYGFLLFDARVGFGTPTTPLGVVFKATLGNTSYLIPESFLEEQAKLLPTDTQQHLNLLIAEYDLNGSRAVGEVKAVGGLMIYNSALQAYVNMTQTCQITKRTANAP